MGREAFETAARTGDMDAMRAALSLDVVFRGPAFPDQIVGRDRVSAILATAFGKAYQDFEYTGVVVGAARTVLLFTARVGEYSLEGAQVLGFNAEDLVSELVMMVRPAPAAAALGHAILAALGLDSASQT